MQDIRFKYADTISINSKKYGYISAGLLKDVHKHGAIVTVSDHMGDFICLEFVKDDSEKNNKLYPIFSDREWKEWVRGYRISLAQALTQLGIYGVKKLTRVPFFWEGTIKSPHMIIDVGALIGNT